MGKLPNKLIIRKFEIEDFPQLIPLLQELWPDKKIDTQKVKGILLEQTNQDGYLVLIAQQDSEIVGLITLSWRLNIYSEGFLACIDEFVVDEKSRDQGVGTQLLEEVFKFCKEKKIAGVYLTSALHREEAHVFYEKNGLKKVSFKFEKYFKR